jgi:hypothetical protein
MHLVGEFQMGGCTVIRFRRGRYGTTVFSGSMQGGVKMVRDPEAVMRLREILRFRQTSAGVVPIELLRALRLPMPDDVLEQFVFDHGTNGEFQERFGDLDLHAVRWQLLALSASERPVKYSPPEQALPGSANSESFSPVYWEGGEHARHENLHLLR